MKIIQFTAENVKRLSAVDITPDEHVVELVGENESGKTSVLDSIWWAIEGGGVIQGEPIRRGQDEALIRLHLGDIIVRRKFTKSGSTALVLNPAGAPPGTPDKKLPKCDWGTTQEILDSLFSALTFDPLEFSRKKEGEQLQALMGIVKLDIDIPALDAASDEDYKRRTTVTREAKAARARADGIQIPDGLPAQPIDETALLNKFQEAADHNAEIEKRRAGRERTKSDAEAKSFEASSVLARVSDLRLQADELEKKAAAFTAAATELEEKLANAEALPEPIDVSGVRGQIQSARTINQNIARREERAAILLGAVKLEQEEEALTAAMKARERQKSDAIKAAKMPVEGLGFGSGCVTYNGVPFEQASDAVRLVVSTRIAMAGNPKLKIIRIRDGSLLDNKKKKILFDMAKEHGYQLWIESIRSDNPLALVIEDGTVKGTQQELSA